MWRGSLTEFTGGIIFGGDVYNNEVVLEGANSNGRDERELGSPLQDFFPLALVGPLKYGEKIVERGGEKGRRRKGKGGEEGEVYVYICVREITGRGKISK